MEINSTDYNSNHFLNNDYFIYFIIIVDNLMLWNPNVKTIF